jgi:isopenicillin N synthase-like dioxygenase
MPALPIVDVSPLRDGSDAAGRARAAAELGAACRELGFFYAVGHGLPPELPARLFAASERFFALPEERKLALAMARGGRAWRGYFPLGGELTAGRPDRKEGLYFGAEAPAATGRPLEGPNLFPEEVPELRPAVLDFMSAAAAAGQALLEGLALALELDAGYFRRHYTARPTTLFRVFRYPPSAAGGGDWGVGEHSDYGLLTLLAQDAVGGLEVRTPRGWIEAPPLEGALVCNLGDMLDRLTGGVFRSTPHRVRNTSGRARLSLAFFLDPALEAEIVPLPGHRASPGTAAERWDRADPHAFTGTYGAYLLGKISQVFPELARDALSAADDQPS